MSLLHPLTRVQIPLPPISTSTKFCSIEKAVLSSCPCVSSKENNYVLMVIDGGRLKFWKPGEKAWTTIETPRGRIKDITYCKGQFYAVGWKIFVCDIGGSDLTTAQVVGAIPIEILVTKAQFIVESNGEVLIVVRARFLGIGEDINIGGIVIPRGANRTGSFAAFGDMSNGGLEELEILGDNMPCSSVKTLPSLFKPPNTREFSLTVSTTATIFFGDHS